MDSDSTLTAHGVKTAGPLSGDLGTGDTTPRPLERQSGGGTARADQQNNGQKRRQHQRIHGADLSFDTLAAALLHYGAQGSQGLDQRGVFRPSIFEPCRHALALRHKCRAANAHRPGMWTATV